MFIRQVKKKNTSGGKTFYQYQLVQASRVNGKVKQRNILYLGSDPLLNNPEPRKELLTLLQAKIFGQPLIFDNYSGQVEILAETYYQKFLIKYKDLPRGSVVSIPPVQGKARVESIDLNSIDIERSRTFGCEYLCSQITETLNLESCFTSLGFSEKENKMAHISIISKAILAASEHKTAQWLQDNSGLKDLFKMNDTEITHHSLYKITDRLYEHKDRIDKFLYNRIVNLFNIDDSLVIYDLSNTYFEGRKVNSKIAGYGRNKERRNDCKQVVFTGVINPEGFIRYSRIYEGNTPDVVTLKDMVDDLKKHSGHVRNKTVVMDAGFASEENLEYLSQEKIKYVCVSRKRLKGYQAEKHATTHILTDRLGNPIELAVFNPKGYKDTWMYVKSERKRIKERSMAEKLSLRFEEQLQGVSEAVHKKGGTKKVEKVWERIGRLKEKHRMVSGKYFIDVKVDNGKVVQVLWHKKQETDGSNQDHGVYFIRTNYSKPQEEQLWNIYNTVREVESTFRCLKSDLQIRPVHHQRDGRIEAHIYLTILAYQLVNSIRHMLKENDINYDWNNIVRIMTSQTIQDLILPTGTKTISLTKPSRPISEALKIYQATNTKSMIPARKKYVVYH